VLGWPSIPPTVVRREGPHGVGAVQLFIDADRRHYLDEQSSRQKTWAQVALFDVIANNADRKSGHCLFDADDHVWVIDHGLTFHVDHKLRTVIGDFPGEPMPPAPPVTTTTLSFSSIASSPYRATGRSCDPWLPRVAWQRENDSCCTPARHPLLWMTAPMGAR